MSEAENSEKIRSGQSHRKADQSLIAGSYRIVDASINRAQEGIRVVEDYCRMVLRDAFFSRQLKQLRHDLTEACSQIEFCGRLRHRESELDVGRFVQTDAEYSRVDVESLLRSNFSRVQQAVRSIEEFTKLHCVDTARNVEQIRYRCYTLEKAVVNAAINQSRFEPASLYVLVDACGERSGFVKLKTLVSELIAAKVDFIQLRDKTLVDRELVLAGKCIGEVVRSTDTQWIMNDRVDLAIAAGADGVHLGQDDLSVHQARNLLGADCLIGVSTHCIEQARQAVVEGADYIGVGPVFESKTKSFEDFVGIELVADVVGELSVPAFAIGGISASNVESILESGCYRVAVSSSVCNSDSPQAAATAIRAKLTKACTEEAINATSGHSDSSRSQDS